MKRLLAILLALTMVLSLAACAEKPQSEPETEPPATEDTPADTDTPADAEPPADTDTPAEPEAPADETEPEPAGREAEEAAVFHNQDAFEGPCVFRPETDGVYSFYASNPSYEMELYDPAGLTWTVYVLDEEFEDGWRYLNQAYRPAICDLLGEMTLSLKAGQYVYCICSNNTFTGDPAEDNTGTLTIYTTNLPFGPVAENDYVQPVSIGAYASYDLDGDGTEDQIFYQVEHAFEDEEGVWTDAKPVTLEVNGQNWLGDGENPMEPFDFWIDNPDVGSYYLVDIDPNDGLVELALADWGVDDWDMTHFFRYENGTLTYLDTITGCPEEGYTSYNGDGTVSAYRRFDVMQTWGGVVTYKLENGKMERVPGEMVEPFPYEERRITLKQPLTVYAEPDKSAEQLTLQPSEEPLELPLTDTEHWVQIICDDGTTGWAYFEESFMVENNGTLVHDTEVFDGLLFAG